jgi:cytochrome P450
VSLRKDDLVILSLTLASRDPDEFERALEVQLERPGNRHFAFGLGPHRCLGSHLARLELQIALDLWHERIPDYRLDGQVLCYAGTVKGLTKLPLRWS